MTLAASGYISLADNPSFRIYPDSRVVNIELGNAANATVAFPSTDTRSLTGRASGSVILPDDFWGKTNTFYFNLPSGANINFRTAAINAGWNGTSYVVGTLPDTYEIYSTSAGTAGLTISGSFPRGVKFINQGKIWGAGGDGGRGSWAGYSGGPISGGNGISGGTALYVSTAVTVDNALGELRGGGGGANGAGGQVTSTKYGNMYYGGGGGGGGAGYNPGTGGLAGYGANAGSDGTTRLGAGGAGGDGNGPYAASLRGGTGGANGSSAGPGAGQVNLTYPAGSTLGGAGSSTQGASTYITWVGVGFGIRTGPVN
jgi:hypothetical protein